jgi:hypothetical protein
MHTGPRELGEILLTQFKHSVQLLYVCKRLIFMRKLTHDPTLLLMIHLYHQNPLTRRLGRPRIPLPKNIFSEAQIHITPRAQLELITHTERHANLTTRKCFIVPDPLHFPLLKIDTQAGSKCLAANTYGTRHAMSPHPSNPSPAEE